MKIKDKEAKFKNIRAIFLSPKLLLPILLETTLNFIIGLQLSSKWYPNGLHFTSKVVSQLVHKSELDLKESPILFLLYLFSYPQRGALKCMTSSDLKSMLTVGILFCSGASALKKCLISSRLKREHFMRCLYNPCLI